MRSAIVPCGTHSSSMRPSRHSVSKTTGSAVRGNEQTILRTWPVSSSAASPTWPTPELLATTVRSFAPWSIKPAISAFGWPMLPKPPTRTTEPSLTPASASAMLCTILLIIVARKPGRLSRYLHLAVGAECRHHFARKPAQCLVGVAGNTAAIEQDILDAEAAELCELGGNLIRTAVERAFLAGFARVGIGHDAGLVSGSGCTRNRFKPPLRLHAALQRGVLVGGILRNEERARDADVKRIESVAEFFHRGFVDGDAFGNRLE